MAEAETSGRPEMTKEKLVIFGTDPGIDDAMALLFLRAQPQIRLLAGPLKAEAAKGGQKLGILCLAVGTSRLQYTLEPFDEIRVGDAQRVCNGFHREPSFNKISRDICFLSLLATGPHGEDFHLHRLATEHALQLADTVFQLLHFQITDNWLV